MGRRSRSPSRLPSTPRARRRKSELNSVSRPRHPLHAAGADLQRELDDVIDVLLHVREACTMEHGEHGGILSENRSTELPDTGEPCGLHQSCQEQGAQAVVLEMVGYYEGHLGPAGLFAPVIAANSDDLALALN